MALWKYDKFVKWLEADPNKEVIIEVEEEDDEKEDETTIQLKIVQKPAIK